MKPKFSTELSYIFGILFLALGTALMEKANFGVSMIVAPAYILHLKISEFYPFFTFGMAEYFLQAVLFLLMLVILRQFRVGYLFSVVTAVVYGFCLDGMMALASLLPADTLVLRLIFYFLGLLICALGVSFFFHTYLSPEVYELMVAEISKKFGWKLKNVKTVYDCVSCAVGILLSFLFFGFGTFRGVQLGTVFCALVNGTAIGWFSKLLESRFTFTDALPWRKYFEK